MLKKYIKYILSKIPLVSKKLKKYYFYVNYYEKTKSILGQFDIDHYYSPIPNLTDLIENRLTIFDKQIDLKEVNLNDTVQLELLNEITKYCKQLPYDLNHDCIKQAYPNAVYNPKSAWYRYSDVVFLFGILNIYKPSKIIEIGCGYSSAVIVDSRDLFLKNNAELIFVEPYPERLLQQLENHEIKNFQILKKKVQSTNINLYKNLNANDVLFIDSSHVSKTGSDLNFILFEILPVLKPGVIIHFHDIFYPFELPEKWVIEKKWYWNENYLLRAFLSNNSKYEIISFNSYLQYKYPEKFVNEMAICFRDQENTGSLWIVKK
jgi:hypothetical protein